MGRRRSRGRGIGYVSIQICALLAPCRRPILIATKAMLFMGQDTSFRGLLAPVGEAPESLPRYSDKRRSGTGFRSSILGSRFR